ncbi:MAG: hypothetical protein M1305_05135 [Candidatus Marsarchaeota archaeon]|nr:hypothetical protein [Candidatus Marsarchaeota archaeon]
MARQYSILDFLRRAPKELLKTFLAQKGIGDHIDWQFMSPNNVEPVFKAIRAADIAVQESIDLAFREINDLGDGRGIETILSEARDSGYPTDMVSALKDMGGCYEKAFWVHVNHHDLFKSARVFDIINDRRTVKRGGFPPLPEEPDDESRERIGQTLSAYFLRRDGRGQGYSVDTYKRGDCYLYYAYLEGFAHSNLVYDDNHELQNDTSRPAFEIIFRYNAAERTLEIAGAAGKRILTDLQMIFANAILRCDIEPPGNRIVYDLSRLSDPGFDLSIDPNSGIRRVRVRRVKATFWGNQGTAVTIAVGRHQGLLDIRRVLDAVAQEERVPDGMMNIVQASFSVEMNPKEGEKRGETVPFSVTYPDTTSLKDGIGAHDVMRAQLRKWGIDVSGSDNGCVDEPALTAQNLLGLQ